ncbi:hypothetical protein CkaCkLH20_04211 [Colletotrichum karsti]|uniref:F-box domain-containing protein n=1 Tax=Colletotrichum karsti TaxID=1095194 RepID=A0A9P6LLU6_9PEZI|nr:uncharacterized protein CkaCkLH20_04211 [Colletotrichum karsti]KAF9878173.1 hypothetical protein CkaCkLH20_04211 [Colletotrichum karsti]
MATFSSQEPDEGYSEDPLNPSFNGAQDTSMTAAHAGAMVPPPDLVAAWIEKQGWTKDEKYRLVNGLLDSLPTSLVIQVFKHINPRLYIDFVSYLPPEVCLKILGFLDPLSLINVAQSCHAWHDLALDRKLWERLYHMEGWQAIYPEIKKWEEQKNQCTERLNSNTIHRVRSSEDGHTYKKRAISEDDDLEMTDADRPLKTEDSFASNNSIFGSPASSFTGFGRSSATPQPGDMDVDRSASGSKSWSADRFDFKGKGKASPLLRTALGKEEPLPSNAPPNRSSKINIPQSELWSWDGSSSGYRLNWKYLYTMRRRLERNWELGKFTNFQFPHPDYPQEGHNECIYSLQYDTEYLVSGSRDWTIRIWSMYNQRLLRKPLVGHNGSVLCLQFDSSPEEDLIVSGSSDSDVILWRFSTGEIIQRLSNAHTESVLNVKFDKRILVTCSKDKSIKIFNRRPLKYGDAGYGDAEIIYSVPTHLRDYGYINPMDQLPIKPAYTMIGVLDGHGAAVNAVQICNDEVVSASGDRNIKVWDWAKQICIRTVVGHSKGIACVQYDGRRIVSGSSDNEVKVFDRASGLEVASLRAHTNLVRTIQAGFGDLPYSEEEDKIQAKRVDNEYFKAIEEGKISPFTEQGSRRSRPRNAGSSKPEDITAYGASLPPGGGGGKYARIVSGSYDQSIIIWRRDKEGVWKDAHHLRQEEASSAAQSQAQAAARAAATHTGPAQAGAASNTAVRTEANAAADATRLTPDAATAPDAVQNITTLIDITVPQGPTALRAMLRDYPAALSHVTHIQNVIAREPNPRTRNELRVILNSSQIETSISQARARQAANGETPGTLVPPTLPSLTALAAANGQDPTLPHHRSTTTDEAPPSGGRPRRQHAPHTTAANLEQMRTGTPTPIPQRSVGPSASQTASPSVQGHLHIQGQAPEQQAQTEAAAPAQAPAQAQPTQPGAPVQTQAQPVPGQGAQQVPEAGHHPRVANDNGPARVFKLQYDARRIICCSQTSVIVGWDFCNGDKELESVARFFATVD